MIPHPKTMQMVTDQRWHELQVRVARERLVVITPLAAGKSGDLPLPNTMTRRRQGVAQWLTTLALVRRVA